MQNDSTNINVPDLTQVTFADDARKQLLNGITIASDAVCCTLGPRGRTVLIQHKGHAPVVTKDGVTVSRSIRLKEPAEALGADLVKEAAIRTNEIAGDGTTTATALAHSMIVEGMKLLTVGMKPNELCTGIRNAVHDIEALIKERSIAVNTWERFNQVAMVSANGDAMIGKVLADAMLRVGKDGIVTVEDAKGMETTLEVAEGMHFERGYVSPYFVTNNEKMIASYQDALLLVCEGKLNSINELVPVLEKVVHARANLLIIADEIEGDALSGLVLNRAKNNLPIIAIRAPGFGRLRTEMLQDICSLTGAELVSGKTGISLKTITLEQLGRTKKVIVGAKTTTIVGPGDNTKSLETYVGDLKARTADVTLSAPEKDQLLSRIARLASGVAVIKVGGQTEIEMIERKYRIEDALNATKAAAEEGIVPGGGMALFHAARTVFDKRKHATGDINIDSGYSIVLKACEAPLNRIIKNAGGKHPEVVINSLNVACDKNNDHNIGYDAFNMKNVNMLEAGIIDPVKVTRTALQNAASVAMTFLTLDAVIHERNNDEDY